ncbi:hypothetical protein [Candidatus Poriferisodalis sp.]|uniref:hypothetical protein n=1 Tax=Candidatus Poriferisodalis sp. TaxID=3101277 RepID=UPI003B02E797
MATHRLVLCRHDSYLLSALRAVEHAGGVQLRRDREHDGFGGRPSRSALMRQRLGAAPKRAAFISRA